MAGEVKPHVIGQMAEGLLDSLRAFADGGPECSTWVTGFAEGYAMRLIALADNVRLARIEAELPPSDVSP